MTGARAAGMGFQRPTWFDRTNYHETFSASAENLDWALAMEADRMVNSFIARKDLDSEMTVVAQRDGKRREQSAQHPRPAHAFGRVRVA